MISEDYKGEMPKLGLNYLAFNKKSWVSVPCKGKCGKWIKIDETFSLPEDVTGMSLQFLTDGNAGSVWLDDVVVTKAKAYYPLWE